MNTAETADRQDVLLQVRDLRTQFRTPLGMLRAVDGVSFDLAAGETFGIVGESGSGKSVLVRTIMNLLPSNAHVPSSGKVLYRGQNVHTLSPLDAKHFWGPEMAMVFQDPMTALNPVKKVGEHLTESMRYHLKVSRKVAASRALSLMREVGIPEPERRLEQYPHELSGGMRQRVVIAMALACEPKLLIADEPTTALDVTVQRQILDLLVRLQADRDMAMILISHDLGVVSGVSDRVAVMYGGHFLEVADTRELFTHVHHPYTEALLRSMPRLELPTGVRLSAIAGRPPDMTAPPPGCRFAARCEYAQHDCEAAIPSLRPGPEPTHLFRCLFPLRIADDGSAVTTDPASDTQQVTA